MITKEQEAELIKKDIHGYLKQYEEKELLRFVTIGSVDDGKSTLIGRLLHDTESVYIDQLDAAKKATKQKTEMEIDLSLITDGLKAEREQGITIDVAYRYFATDKRKFIIADTPGHEQYTRNMATGASTAEVALILIDARHGVLSQSKRHAMISSLLGIPHLVVCINKMDLKNYSQEVYETIKKDFLEFSSDLNFKKVHFFPVSALIGDNVVEKSPQTPWYDGPALLDFLETVPLDRQINEKDFAFPVQYVLRPDLNFRGYAGTISAGLVKKGDAIIVLPSGKESRVKSIVTYEGEKDEAYSPQSVVITLEDEIDISRGDMITHKTNELHVSRKLQADLVWMNDQSLELNKPYTVKQGTNSVTGLINEIQYQLDINTLEKKQKSTLELNDIGKVNLLLNRPLSFDLYQKNRRLGSFILIDRISNATVAAGMISAHGMDEQVDKRVLASELKSSERAARFAQKPSMIWLTGLPGSGKLIFARALERSLFEAGHFAYLLDPERFPSLGRHASASKIDDLIEHAKRLNDMGLIAISAFTTPNESDRQKARQSFDQFFEIYFKADKSLCEERLQSLGRDLNELDIHYQEPSNPESIIESQGLNHEKEIIKLIDQLHKKGILNS